MIALEPDVGTLGELSTLVGRHPSIDVILAGLESTLPRGSTTELRGEVSLHASNRYGRREQAALAALREAGLGLEESLRSRGVLAVGSGDGLCRYVACVTSSCGSSILMEETAKAIAALHPAVRPRGHIGRFARPALPEPLVRASLVIVLDELVQHPRQMMPPKDQ